MHRPELPDPRELLRDARRVVVLEDIVDHTNVGAIVRNCAALGADAILVTPRCADPLYRRSVRVSMGTIFQVPWTRIDPWPGGLSLLREQGFVTAALALSENSISLDDLSADLPERLALILGSEGDGLSLNTIAASDVVVRIPMIGGVDSLNVAAASAVALWATR
jgi:tRNA G18 (ribose-2'-O)-methylase SpoU